MRVLYIALFSLFALTVCDLPVIDVFVESLCPDCMDFIGGSFKNFHEYKDKDSLAVVNFYPYGNAAEKWNGKSWDFTCQHGANECYGNTIETCALNLIDKNAGHDFMICIEGSIRQYAKDFNQTLSHCVDEEMKAKILNCVSLGEGNKLQHEVAQKTPEHNYVPWVHVNGQHVKDVENKILSNMVEYLCELQGKECSEHNKNFKAKPLGSKCINYQQLEFLKILQ